LVKNESIVPIFVQNLINLFKSRKKMIVKIINLLKLLFGYFLSQLIKRPIHFGMPFCISIEPTNICNLSCPQCPTGMKTLKRAKGYADLSQIKRTLDELSPFLFSCIFYFQGEPFLNPEIFEMIKYANDKGIYTITSTNGHFIDQSTAKKIIRSKLNKLIVSIDGTNQETYEQYRVNGKLSKVIEGVKMLTQFREELNSKTPKIVFQFLVTAKNEHQIEDAKKLALQLKVDKIEFKTAQIYDFKNGSKFIPLNEKYSRYKKMTNGNYELKWNDKNKCWRMWSNPVVTVSGDVVPCCFDKDANFKMGNLKNVRFTEIWQSSNYNKFRAQIFKNRKDIDMCTNCTEGLFKVHL